MLVINSSVSETPQRIELLRNQNDLPDEMSWNACLFQSFEHDFVTIVARNFIYGILFLTPSSVIS